VRGMGMAGDGCMVALFSSGVVEVIPPLYID
jgi:hypothetical protein